MQIESQVKMVERPESATSQSTKSRNQREVLAKKPRRRIGRGEAKKVRFAR